LPIELFGTREEQMRDVGPVVTLALLDERFRPDHLLDRA
jgi:hypothetical protein